MTDRRRPAGPARREEFYDSPLYYHVAFDLNRKREADFFEACFKKYGRRPVRRILDVACGTGHHALRLARRGYAVTALDLSPRSIEFLRQEAAAAGLPVDAVVGDMTDFRLPRPVDAVVCTQDSQGHLLTNEALVAHLRAVRDNLRPGGLYLFDRMVPYRWGLTRYAWTKRRRGVTVRTTFRTLLDYDPISQVCREEMRFDIEAGGRRHVVTQQHRTRVVFPQELRALVALAGGLELAAWFSNFDLRQPLERATGAMMLVAVLLRP